MCCFSGTWLSEVSKSSWIALGKLAWNDPSCRILPLKFQQWISPMPTPAAFSIAVVMTNPHTSLSFPPDFPSSYTPARGSNTAIDFGTTTVAQISPISS